MIAMLLVVLTGAVSAWLYARTGRRTDAALVLTAALSLAVLLGDFHTPAPLVEDLPIDPAAAVVDLRSAASVRVTGDGMSAARWRDLPARPLRWDTPGGERLTLDFPRSVPPGGVFTLTAAWARREHWRLQLLDEEGRVLAQSAGRGLRQSVRWTPPASEDIVLRARLLDAKGARLAEGPVPLRVEPAPRLRVRGRFSAPSFDVRALRALFESSGALLDWQVALAPGVSGSHAPAAPMDAADLLIVDARWLERRGEDERAAVLAQVGAGARLLVLGANARERELWSATLALALEPREHAEPAPAAALPTTRAPWRVLAQGPWVLGDTLATRVYGAGRIGWLSAADWHRHAIADPSGLALWWQDVLDRLAVAHSGSFAWAEPEAMPLAGQRLEVCAYGATGQISFPQLRRQLTWQRRADRADAACVALWPTSSGWLEARSGAHATRIFVYASTHWPAWQAALKQDATRRYAARTPAVGQARDTPVPAWPFATVFVLAMLGLWWRERSAPDGGAGAGLTTAAPPNADPASTPSSR